MKKVAILGHFGFGQEKTNGQTIKTKIIADELSRTYSDEQIGKKDTMGKWRFLFQCPFLLFSLLRNYLNIVFLPAYKGVLIIVPLIVLLNKLFHRRLHYVVIGGWLPSYVEKYYFLRKFAHHIDYIYVETEHMLREMKSKGFKNIVLMPNCKPLDIISEEEASNKPRVSRTSSIPLCTFSRVMKQKGIEDAIEAVKSCNLQNREKAYTLDIYGPIEKGEEQWFKNLMEKQPETIKYCGVVPYGNSTSTLCNYFALLFPTRFKTEGFAGTLIDAMAAGTPPIASDCDSNIEIIEDGKTGILFPMNSQDALTNILNQIYRHPEIINEMRSNCIRHSYDFLPGNVIKILTDQIDQS